MQKRPVNERWGSLHPRANVIDIESLKSKHGGRELQRSFTGRFYILFIIFNPSVLFILFYTFDSQCLHEIQEYSELSVFLHFGSPCSYENQEYFGLSVFPTFCAMGTVQSADREKLAKHCSSFCNFTKKLNSGFSQFCPSLNTNKHEIKQLTFDL